ncbi:MAG: Gfo/Idh/MocA family oxidoreductase [Pseudomonadota bacterium]
MNSEVIRVGVIGAGGNTRKRHIPGLLEQANVDIVAVANRTRESSATAAAEFGIPRACDDWREVIDNPDIDAVCIGTWPYMHSTLTCMALDAGKHVLVEARMASSFSEAQTMLAASRRNPHLIAQIVPAPHTLPLDRTIREMIAEGFIGDLIAVDARITSGSTFPQADSALHWRHERQFSGNNAMSMGIWYEALTRWVGQTTTVQACAQVVVSHRRDANGRRTGISIPDHIDTLSTLAQGGQMRLSVSTVVGHPPPTTVWVFGHEGTLRVSPGADGELALWAGRATDSDLVEVVIPESKRGGWRVEEEFIRAIRAEETITHTDFVTGCHYMAWTDAVAESWRTGNRVTVQSA